MGIENKIPEYIKFKYFSAGGISYAIMREL
jgi:hypothetical protein